MFINRKRGVYLGEDVVIPPVPSKKKKKLEEGFIKTDEELPTFDEHELKGAKETEITEKIKQTTKDYTQLPYDVVHKIIRATCLVALVIWFVLIIFLSVLTKSDLFNTLIGLAPVLLTIITTYILVDKYHMESGFLLVFPIIYTGLLFMLGTGNVISGIDYRNLTTLNLIFGLLFEVVIIMHYGILRRQRRTKVKEVKKEEKKKIIIKLDDEEGLKTFVSSIEDKSKAINAAIGRVYSVRHGGTEPVRKKIKIDAAHYNEFNELKHEKPHHRKPIAIKLLRKIKERLEVFQQPEKDVFDKDDLESFLKLDKNPDGNDKIINVLIKNDKDPIKAYYDGAINFCNDALEQLEKEEHKKK